MRKRKGVAASCRGDHYFLSSRLIVAAGPNLRCALSTDANG
jgi:hypothetical protein